MRYLLLLIVITITTGCGIDPVKVAQTGTKAVYVDELIKSGAVLDAAINSSLPESDVKIVADSLAEYNKFRELWGSRIKNDPMKLLTDMGSFSSSYRALRTYYTNVENVVIRNWDTYSDGTKVVLKEYQDRARALDELVLTLLSESKTSTAVIAIEELAVVVGRIALAVM